MTTNNRGGKRSGAGRPSLHGERGEPVTVNIPPSIAGQATLKAESYGLSRSAWIVHIIKSALQEDK